MTIPVALHGQLSKYSLPGDEDPCHQISVHHLQKTKKASYNLKFGFISNTGKFSLKLKW